MNSPTEDAVMAIVAAMVAAEVVPAAVPHQAIKALPRMLQTSVDGASKAIQVVRKVAG